MEKTRCNYCKNEIASDATVCHNCSRTQNKILNWINNFNYLAVFISIALLLVSMRQCSESTKERKAATEAFKIADSLKKSTYKLYGQVDSLKNELDSTVKYFEDIALLTTQNAWINANVPIFGFDVNRPSVKQFEKNTSTLVDKIVKDSVKIEDWWRKTDSLINPKKYKK
jgi:hypothetical protein